MLAPRDVVVTGIGAVSPYGVGRGALWDGIRHGKSCIDWISAFDATDLPVRYAGEIRDFDVDAHLQNRCEARRDRSIQFGLVAAREALLGAGLLNDQERIDDSLVVGCVLGSGLGPCHEAVFNYQCFFEKGSRALRPTGIPKSMHNALASYISIHFGLRGSSQVIASACTSSSAAIGLASLLIKHGQEDVVLCGGSDSPLNPAMFSCWCALRVLARHDAPARASRPFDRNRNGLVLSEGAAMIVLESAEHAINRGAEVLGRIAGYGTSSDAHHITAPTVAGQVAAMRRCLSDAQVQPDEIDYINMHGTGTQANDETEAHAVLEVFGARREAMPVSSTKSMVGHTLGASGAIEFVVCVESLLNDYITPTVNCDNPDPEVGLDYVPHQGRDHLLKHIISNSFAFGGSNSSLLVSRPE